MSEDAPELTAELVVDGAVPSQPAVSPDGCGAAEVAEPVAVLVPHQLADEFGSVWPQAVEDVIDVFDGEHGGRPEYAR